MGLLHPVLSDPPGASFARRRATKVQPFERVEPKSMSELSSICRPRGAANELDVG